MAGVVCDSCGTANPPGRRFCENCDGFLDWSAAPAAEPAATAPGPAAPTSVGPPPTRPAPEPVASGATRPRSANPPPPTSPVERNPPGAAEPPPYPGATFGPVATPPFDTVPMQLTCRNCGTGSDPTRRFCRRCGTWLVTPTRVAPAPPARLGTRLRRRWWGGPAGAYTADLTPGTIGFRALAVGLVLVLVAGVLALAGLHPVRRATDLVGHVLGSGRVERVAARAEPADAFAGIPADWAVDDVRGRGFATRWVAASPGTPDLACRGAQSGTVSSLVLRFPGPTDVREIGVEAGLPAGDPQLAARWRPQALELHWSNGVCQAVTLAEDPGLQRFAVGQDVDATLVDGVEVVVVAGYRPQSGGSDRLDIGEITFWAR